MLNLRHKIISFITLVAAGSGLLAGITLNEGLGILLLGAAFAWLAGSDAASRTYRYLRSSPGRTWPWVRVVLLMALGGALLAAVAVWSNVNPFLTATAMSIWGMVISPFSRLPTQRRWSSFTAWGLGVVVFILATVAVSVLSGAPGELAERMGEQAVYGLIALALGIVWLVKGWKLILAGICAESPPATAQGESASKVKGTRWLYVSLVAGTIVLTLCLGLLAFSQFSDSVFPSMVTPKPSNPPNPVFSAFFLMLLAWWPYTCWKRILQREPNSSPANVKTHKLVTFGLGGLFTVALCVATAFGIENGNDRKTTAEVGEATKGFQDIASKIGAIKGRDLRTAKDYIDAYEEIDPLLLQFDDKLQRFTEILSEAEQRDRSRGPLNIQRLYGKKEEQWLVWDNQTFELLRQDSQLTRKQVTVARQMGMLPQEDQVEFWERNFRPLAEQENVLRRQLAALQKNMPVSTK